jgi:predicted enzyme related to lactoylglutathione lyase
MKDIIHFYPTNDLKRIKHTYEAGLGFELYKDQGKCLIFDTQGHGKIGFCTHHPKNPPHSTCITLVVEDKHSVDKTYEQFRSIPKTVHKPSLNTTFNIYHAFLEDFEGRQIEVQTFL